MSILDRRGRSAARAVLTLLTAFGAGSGGASAIGTHAIAEMRLVDGTSAGRIVLVESSAGVLLKLHMKGLPPGPHAVQIHEAAKCEGEFGSAGAIFNPTKAKHGLLNEEGPMLGDLPNVVASAEGAVEAELLDPFVTLAVDADESLLHGSGTSVVVFALADDHRTQPEGNAGARLACGVVSAPKS